MPCGDATVMRVPVDGGSAVAVAVVEAGPPWGMAVDATSIYFTADGVFKITPK